MLQLVYMWVEDSRTLKEVNLNFHSNFEFEFEPIKRQKIEFSYEEKESVIEGKLKIKKFNLDDKFVNEYFPENQFISLIVGKNGTGKSSVLELLELIENSTTYYVPHIGEKKHHLENKFFCIFLDKDNNKLFLWGAIIHKKDKSKIRFVGFNEISQIKELTLKLPPKEVCSQDSRTKLEKIYFSLNDYEIQIHLISKEFKERWQKPIVGSSRGKEFKSNYLKDNHSFLRNLFKCGNVEIISGILSHDDYTKFPDYFIIKFPLGHLIKDGKDYSFEEFLEEVEKSKLSEDKKDLVISVVKQLKNMTEKLGERVKNLDFIEKIKAILFTHSFLDFLYNIMTTFEAWEFFWESKEFEDIISKLESANVEKESIETIIDNLYFYYRNKNYINLYIEEVSSFINSLNSLHLILSGKMKEKLTYEGYLEIRIPLERYMSSEEVVSKINDLVGKYINLKFHSFDPIKFDFRPPLSSGQRALLSVFADISEVLDGEDCSRKDKEENVILLLDEPDVYFHPEWQRLFIYFLTEFLKKKYQEREFLNKKINKKIHTIITTHSPFMLSDIPKGNCVFLELDIKEDEKGRIQEYKTVVKPKEKIHNTLAQNIYYLLADGFFMEKGIGEYIRLKLLEMLKKGNKDYEFYRKLVSQIGDEIYRKRFEIYLEKIQGKNQ